MEYTSYDFTRPYYSDGKTPLEKMHQDLRRAGRWLEQAGRHNLLESLPHNTYNRDKTIETVQYIHGMTQAFLKAASLDGEVRYRYPYIEASN
jgi:hypothetical protein